MCDPDLCNTIAALFCNIMVSTAALQIKLVIGGHKRDRISHRWP